MGSVVWATGVSGSVGQCGMISIAKKVSELILEREELEGKLAIVQGNYAKSQERVFAAEATIAERILDNENQISDAERLIKQRDGEIIALNAKLHDYQQKTIAHKRDLSAVRYSY
eukprot:1025183-Amorphochlora_amoeboformis.AAC.1